MRRDEIIDPRDEAFDTRFRRLVSLIAPFLGIVAIVAGISLVSVHSYHVTRERVINLTQTLLNEQQKLLTREVSDYLGPAPQSATIAKDLLIEPLGDAPPTTFLNFGRALLGHLPQIDSLFIADDQGQFWFIDHAPPKISNGVEWVHLVKEQDVFRHWYYDQQGKLVRQLDKPARGYDPRDKEWYQSAVHHPEITWTDPYPSKARREIFSTASSVLTSTDGHQAVFAINLSLTRLSDFLKKMKIGKKGRAIILDTQGRVVAGDRLLDVAAHAKWTFDLMTINAKAEPVFSRALSLYKIYGSGARVLPGQDTRFVTIYASLDQIRPGWLLILDTPESDYEKIISLAGWQGFAFSILIIVLASGLALLLLRQKRRTQRATRQVELMQDRERRAQGLMSVLADNDAIFDVSQPALILSETIANLVSAHRVAIWRKLSHKNHFICEDSFDAQSGQHSAGMEITPEDASPMIQALKGSDTPSTRDLADHAAFEALWKVDAHHHEGPRNVVPMMRLDELCGFLQLEGADLTSTEARFIPLLSDVIALRFAAIAQREDDDAKRPKDLDHTALGRVHATQLNQSTPNVEFVSGGKEVLHPGQQSTLAVGVIYFVHQDAPDVSAVITLFKDLACVLEDVARTHDLQSVQLAGNRVLLVGRAGSQNLMPAVAPVADALLALRDAAQHKLSAENLVRHFKMGLDVGVVLQADVGQKTHQKAFWGDAFDVADRLAASAPETGTIQVSEQARESLRVAFLFRPRGQFFIPGRGMTATYVLVARQ